MSAGDGPRRRRYHHHPCHLPSTTLPDPGLLKVTLLRCCHCLFLSSEIHLSFHLLAIWPCFINPAECNTLYCNLPPLVFISFVSLPQGSGSLSCCNHFSAVLALVFPVDLEIFFKILLLRLSCVCVRTHPHSYTPLCTQRSEDNF